MSDTSAEPSPESLVAGLKALLDVETLDTDLYRGPALPGATGRVFGGQVIGQGLMAACQSVDTGRMPHSLHAYFLRAGDNTRPIIFRVVRDYDGGSFTNRRVIASQGGQPILNMTASFQTPEKGMEHGTDMPNVPGPDDLPTEREHALTHQEMLSPQLVEALTRPWPIETRPVASRTLNMGIKRDPVQYVWVRTVTSLGDISQNMHRSVLAYLSDMALLSTAYLPHGIDWFTENFQSASLDHAIWFHDDVQADDWMLYAMDSPWSGNARGVNRGKLFTRDGRLIASTAQEGLMRMRTPKA